MNEHDDNQLEKSIRITSDQYKMLQKFPNYEDKQSFQNIKFEMQRVKKS